MSTHSRTLADYINPIDLCNKLNQVGSLESVMIREERCRADGCVPVCPPRDDRTCLSHPLFPAFWTMAGVCPQCSIGCIQREQVGQSYRLHLTLGLLLPLHHPSSASSSHCLSSQLSLSLSFALYSSTIGCILLTQSHHPGSCRKTTCTTLPRYSEHCRDIKKRVLSNSVSTSSHSSTISTGMSHIPIPILTLKLLKLYTVNCMLIKMVRMVE